MSRPPINPEKTTAGIAIDPQTLERVIPESRRPDGSIRKQLKVRPGFTPQEDVKRFRGTKQAQMDANVLPKGHIIGWAPAPSAAQSTKPASKSAKKNAKRKEKREEKKTNTAAEEPVRESWEDDDDEEATPKVSRDPAADTADATKTGAPSSQHTTDKLKGKGSPGAKDAAEKLASELEKLDVN